MGDGVKRVYEALFLVDSALASSDWDGVMEAINTIMSRSSADVISIRKWDERKLAYEIDGHKRGTYILAYFHVAPAMVAKMERDVVLNEQILRVMILRADHMSDEQMSAPTPIAKASMEASSEGESHSESSVAVAEQEPAGGDDSSDAKPSSETESDAKNENSDG